MASKDDIEDSDSDSDWETDSDDDPELDTNPGKPPKIQIPPKDRQETRCDQTGVSTFTSPSLIKQRTDHDYPGESSFLSPYLNPDQKRLDQSFSSRSGESSVGSISESNGSMETVIYVPPKTEDSVDKDKTSQDPVSDLRNSKQNPEQEYDFSRQQYPDNKSTFPYGRLRGNDLNPGSSGADPDYPYSSQNPSNPMSLGPDPDFPMPPPSILDPCPTDRSSSTLSESDSMPLQDRSSDFDADGDGDWGDTFDSDTEILDQSGEGFSRNSSVIRLPGSQHSSKRSSMPSGSASDSSASDFPPPSKVSSLSLSRDSVKNQSYDSDNLFSPFKPPDFATFKSTGDVPIPKVDLNEPQVPRSSLTFMPCVTAEKPLEPIPPPQNTRYKGIDPTASLKGVCSKKDTPKPFYKPVGERYNISRSEPSSRYSPPGNPICRQSANNISPSNPARSNYEHTGAPRQSEYSSVPKFNSIKRASHPYPPKQRNSSSGSSNARVSSGSSNSRPPSILMNPDSLNHSTRSNRSRSVTFADTSQTTDHESDPPSLENSISRSHSLLNFTDATSAKRKFYRHLFAYNCAFFLLFSAFIGLAVVQSSLNGQVGAVSLSILFLVSIFSCIFISPIANSLIGCKPTIVICFVGFLVWEASNFYPHHGTMIPAAIICGTAYGSVWAAQATHFTELSINYAEVVRDRVDAVISRSFGLFFCFLLLGTSFGCLLTSFFLSYDLDPANPTPSPPVDGPKYHCGPHFCPRGPTRPSNSVEKTSDVSPYLFPNAWALSHQNSNSKYSQTNAKSGGTTLTSNDLPDHSTMSGTNEIYLMIGIHVLCTGIAICMILFFVDPLPTEKFVDSSAQQAKRSIIATLKQLKRKRQLLMTVLNVYVGMSRSLMLADIAQAYIGCALGVEMIGYTCATYGVCACIAAIGSGYLMRRSGRKPLFILAFVIAVAMLILLLLWTPDSRRVAMFFIIPGIWAFPDGIYVSQINAFYGFMFQDNSSAAFAVFRFWEGIGLVIGYIFNSFVCVKVKLYLMLVLLCLGTLGYFVTESVQAKLEKAHKHVTLTFLDGGSVSQRISSGGGGSLFSPHRNMIQLYRSPPQMQNDSGVFNITGVFESSI